MQLRRIRGFLLLRLQDVEGATGVPAYRLAKAEAERLILNPAEEFALRKFYWAKIRMALGEQAATRRLQN